MVGNEATLPEDEILDPEGDVFVVQGGKTEQTVDESQGLVFAIQGALDLLLNLVATDETGNVDDGFPQRLRRARVLVFAEELHLQYSPIGPIVAVNEETEVGVEQPFRPEVRAKSTDVLLVGYLDLEKHVRLLPSAVVDVIFEKFTIGDVDVQQSHLGFEELARFGPVLSKMTRFATHFNATVQ